MEMAHHIHAIQEDLAAAASLASDEATVEAGRRLTQALGSSLHLRLLDVVSEAALALSGSVPGRIEVRLAGRDPELVYIEEEEEPERRADRERRRRLLRTHHPAPARRAEGAARGRRQSGRHLGQCLDRARASARARASHPFCSHRPASVRLRGQLGKEKHVSRLHPIPYGAGVLLRSGLVLPLPSATTASSGLRARSRSPAVHAFDTPGKTRLRVKNAAGLISVDPSETGRTTVELEALRDDDATREAIERATVELNGNEVTVEIGVGGKGFGVGPAWISFGRTPSGRRPHPLPRRHRPRVHDRIRRRRRHRPARRRGAEDGVRRRRRRARRRRSASSRPAGTSVPRRSTARHAFRPSPATSASARSRVRSRRRSSRATSRSTTPTPTCRAKTVSGDQRIGAIREGQIKRPVGLGRRPHRRPPRHAPPDRRQLDERRRQLRARRQGHAVGGIERNRGAAGGEDRQRRHRDHPGRGRLSLT